MAVHAENGLVAVGRVLDDVLDEGREFVRLGIAHGIGQVDGGRPGLDGRLHHPAEEILVRTGGVLGGEFHVVGIARAATHPGLDHLEHHLRLLAQLVLHVQGRRGEEGVDARTPGHLDGLPAAVDVVVHATGQTGDLDVARLLGDAAHGLEVAGAGSREARFHDVHAQHFQLMGQAQFLLKIHGRAGRLLAVTQRSVEKVNLVVHDAHLLWHGASSSGRLPA